ncbi:MULTISPECIES: cytochrome c [unclassified Prosthecochloris]|uniref:cytochrome c n=1 Tax=unclassified Prosthecochloris TaxID=2632826 RepID=UPI00223D6276|nr:MULTISPECIES: c-type cytochrome [unclassified Prosthecochloris]UZJ37674.1 cytochrome c [Prosthecochloris sp. SCSIO W1103]
MKGQTVLKALFFMAMLPLIISCETEGEKTAVSAVDISKSSSVSKEPDELQGLKLYLGYCFVCHGQSGKGNGPYAEKLSSPPADFSDSTYFGGKTDEELYDFISKGGLAHGKSMHMKPFGFQLTPEQIQNAIAFIRMVNRDGRIDAAEDQGYSGEEIYNNSCVMCHGASGRGDGRVSKMMNINVRPLSPETLAEYSAAGLFNVVEQGFPPESTGIRSYMPAWGNTLTEKEIIDVIDYIRTFGE